MSTLGTQCNPSPSYPTGPPPSPGLNLGSIPSPRHIPGTATDVVGMSNLGQAETTFLNIKQLPDEVRERIVIHRDPRVYMLGKSMTRYKNWLTKAPSGVEYE